MSNKIAIYPGSFDPITLGHLDIIKRSLKLFDNVIIAIGDNPYKNNMFSKKERTNMIIETIKSHLPNNMQKKVSVQAFSGLVVDFAKNNDIDIIIRGIRALSDFDSEFTMAGINSKLNKNIETIFIMATEKNQYISSSMVKNIAQNNGELSLFLPINVIKSVEKKL